MNPVSYFLEKAKERMIELHLKGRGLEDDAVLEAMRAVARELFVPESLLLYAYEDSPLPIGEGQTISQPFIVATMAHLAHLKGVGSGQSVLESVLEIGAGSGYGAAVLSQLADVVYAVERIASLVELARNHLAQGGYDRVHLLWGDGHLGWKEHAPYDAIVVTAGAEEVPRELQEQLRVGGRLILPLGEGGMQELVVITRHSVDRFSREIVEPVRFVPLLEGTVS